MQTFKLEFTPQQMDILTEALVNQPYKTVATFLNEIQRQVQPQMQQVQIQPQEPGEHPETK